MTWPQWFVSFSSAGRLPCCMEPFLEQVKSVLQFKPNFSFPFDLIVCTNNKGKTGEGDEARHLRLEEALKEVMIGLPIATVEIVSKQERKGPINMIHVKGAEECGGGGKEKGEPFPLHQHQPWLEGGTCL